MMLRRSCSKQKHQKQMKHMRRLISKGKIGLMWRSEEGFAETKAKARKGKINERSSRAK